MTRQLTAQSIFAAALAMTSFGMACAVSGPVTHPADCTLIVNDKSYISGICEFSPDDKNGSFSIFGEQYWAMVNVKHGKGEASWNGVASANNASSVLGNVHRVGGCWEGAKVRICARDIDKPRLKAIMATRPKGLMLSPENQENLCVSAPGYKFEPGAALVMDRCDHFLGLQQRVFKRTVDKISFEGKPALCIDAKPSADAKETRLVLDDCAHVTVRWSFDQDTNAIRSSTNLCWDVNFPENQKDDGTASPMIARPCAQDPEKNRQFISRDGLGDGD